MTKENADKLLKLLQEGTVHMSNHIDFDYPMPPFDQHDPLGNIPAPAGATVYTTAHTNHLAQTQVLYPNTAPDPTEDTASAMRARRWDA